MIIAKITVAIFATLFCVSFLLWGVQGIVNYCASFIAFSLVAIATFYGYKKVVLSSEANAQALQNEPDNEDEEEEKPTKMSLLTKTYKGWLFPVRLAAYALFVLVFLYFANNGILHIPSFLVGIAVLPISALIFMFFFRREF